MQAQARLIEMDRYAFAVRSKVAYKQRLLGVGHGFDGTPTVRAELGSNGWLCLQMVVGIGFLEAITHRLG